MEVAALCLLLLNLLDSGSAHVSLTIIPNRSQFFKFDSFSVSCEVGEQNMDGSIGQGVMKRIVDGEVHKCPHPCSIPAAFPATDSGEYWCETGQEITSDAVNITVTAGSVILESPVLPVMEGDSVPLCCRSKVLPSACSPRADFYKGGVLIGTTSTGNMTIANVSKSHEGQYKCSISESGHSPESWLRVRASASASDPSPSLLFHLRHLLMATLYLLSTILLALILKDRKREQQAQELRQRPEGVVMMTSSL